MELETLDVETFNGIDYTTGDYLTPAVATSEVAQWALQGRRDLKEERDLQWFYQRDFRNRGPDRRPAADVNPMDLSSSGWAVIVPKGTPPAVIDALRPLLNHRREQASKKTEKNYRELDYIAGESNDNFLKRLNVEKGPAHPKQLPYYLLLIGDPKAIPYRFQYLLDMQYAVGRLHFDEPDDYRSYAESVVAAECGRSHVSPEACFFSARIPLDSATRISEERLVLPLIETLKTTVPEWRLRSVVGEQADKSALHRLLGGDETPALLLTAAHGLRFTKDHQLQREHQGGIICRDWPGRKRPVLDHHYFSAADVGDDAHVHGLIAFLFGCYSAGTPDEDNFPASSAWGQPAQPPSEPFISGLARRLMSHPNGGALAIVGHVDRAWACSLGSGRGSGILHVESFFQQLLEGFPIGLAMDWLNERFAEMSTRLTEILDRHKKEGSLSAEGQNMLAELWRANNDARNFVVLGDPAVRLAAGPQIGRTRAVAELRMSGGGLHIPARSHWARHVEGWLTEIETREPVDLGVDPETAVRNLRGGREEVEDESCS